MPADKPAPKVLTVGIPRDDIAVPRVLGSVNGAPLGFGTLASDGPKVGGNKGDDIPLTPIPGAVVPGDTTGTVPEVVVFGGTASSDGDTD